jgi:hypothetical protein
MAPALAMSSALRPGVGRQLPGLKETRCAKTIPANRSDASLDQPGQDPWSNEELDAARQFYTDFITQHGLSAWGTADDPLNAYKTLRQRGQSVDDARQGALAQLGWNDSGEVAERGRAGGAARAPAAADRARRGAKLAALARISSRRRCSTRAGRPGSPISRRTPNVHRAAVQRAQRGRTP